MSPSSARETARSWSKTFAGIPNPAWSARIMERVNGRRPDKTSDALLRLPMNGTRSRGERQNPRRYLASARASHSSASRVKYWTRVFLYSLVE